MAHKEIAIVSSKFKTQTLFISSLLRYIEHAITSKMLQMTLALRFDMTYEIQYLQHGRYPGE